MLDNFSATFPKSKSELQQLSFPGEPIAFSAPSWADLYEFCFELATQIRASQQHFDRIITLAKGGWPMTVSLMDLLEIDQVASIGVKFYAGMNQRLAQPVIYQNLPVAVEGETVLLFDDVADSGQSLKFVTDHLLESGAAGVKTATLIYKPHSAIKPDYYAAQTETWIVFPNELAETTKSLGLKWRSAGLTRQEISARLQKFGFKPAWLQSYLDKIFT